MPLKKKHSRKHVSPQKTKASIPSKEKAYPGQRLLTPTPTNREMRPQITSFAIARKKKRPKST